MVNTNHNHNGDRMHETTRALLNYVRTHPGCGRDEIEAVLPLHISRELGPAAAAGRLSWSLQGGWRVSAWA
jgi:hypothetical protein